MGSEISTGKPSMRRVVAVFRRTRRGASVVRVIDVVLVRGARVSAVFARVDVHASSRPTTAPQSLASRSAAHRRTIARVSAAMRDARRRRLFVSIASFADASPPNRAAAARAAASAASRLEMARNASTSGAHDAHVNDRGDAEDESPNRRRD